MRAGGGAAGWARAGAAGRARRGILLSLTPGEPAALRCTMLIIAIILLGMIAGAGAQLLLQREGGINWPLAFVTGIIGSFVGGLFLSFITGHGLELHLSGILGSIFGAALVTLIWDWFQKRRAPDPGPDDRPDPLHPDHRAG